jgi:hypothetical protein
MPIRRVWRRRLVKPNERYVMRMALVGLSLLAAGCAAQGKPYERVNAPSNTATIYVYRPYSFFGSLMHPTVRCGNQSAVIEPGGYHVFVVPAGATTCSTSTETADVLDIDGEPRVYYVRERMGWGLLVGRPELNPVDNDQAQSEIQSCCVEQP